MRIQFHRWVTKGYVLKRTEILGTLISGLTDSETQKWCDFLVKGDKVLGCLQQGIESRSLKRVQSKIIREIEISKSRGLEKEPEFNKKNSSCPEGKEPCYSRGSEFLGFEKDSQGDSVPVVHLVTLFNTVRKFTTKDS